jgi:hypothetical protein
MNNRILSIVVSSVSLGILIIGIMGLVKVVFIPQWGWGMIVVAYVLCLCISVYQLFKGMDVI